MDMCGTAVMVYHGVTRTLQSTSFVAIEGGSSPIESAQWNTIKRRIFSRRNQSINQLSFYSANIPGEGSKHSFLENDIDQIDIWERNTCSFENTSRPASPQGMQLC